jgi:hypothetical protein
MALEILIPSSALTRQKRLECFCGKAFPETQQSQYVRHLRACSKRHREEIMHQAEERTKTPFTGAVLDPELYRHLREGGT